MTALLARHPHTLALLFAEGLEVGGIRCHPVIVHILLIRRAADGSVATYAKGAHRALLDKFHLDLLALQLRLTEASAKQVGWDATVLLTDLHIQALGLAMHHTGLAPGQAGQCEQAQQQKNTHRPIPQKICRRL